ncbi:MAG: DoxX family protein [Bacteroidia bacterium]|nr:DoxX family protein [Bacteroidia bacterium]
MKGFHKGIRRFCTVLAGLVFFGAGMLKLMDPVGAGLVVDEYFKFFHMPWLTFASKGVGVAMALIETLIGAALLAGVWRKAMALVTGILTLGFTVLTLILVIYNPEMDCGCFGEAIHLTHMQTFLKNVALCAVCAIAFLPFKDFGETRKAKVIAFGIVAASVLAFTAFELVSLPLIDFSEFAPGTELAESEDDENVNDGLTLNGENDTKQEYYVIYEKNGQEGAFTLDKLPDSTWTFVRAEMIGRSISDYNGSTPLLFISDSDGEYHNELLSEGKVMVLSIYDSKRYKSIGKAEKFLSDAREAGFNAIVVSREPLLDLDSYMSDYKKVITLNRSNGGATFLDNGEVIRKWPARSLPDSGDLQKAISKNSAEMMVSSTAKGRIFFQGFVLYSLAILLIL